MGGATSTTGNDYSGGFFYGLNGGVLKQQIGVVGANYALGAATLGFAWSHTQLDYLDGSSRKFNNYDVNARYQLTPAATLIGVYVHRRARERPAGTGGQTLKPRWHQFTLGFDYALSKRTDIYLSGIYQLAAGDEHGNVGRLSQDRGDLEHRQRVVDEPPGRVRHWAAREVLTARVSGAVQRGAAWCDKQSGNRCLSHRVRLPRMGVSPRAAPAHDTRSTMTDSVSRPTTRSGRRSTAPARRLMGGSDAACRRRAGEPAARPLSALPLDVPPWTREPGAPLLSPPYGVPGPHERDVIRRSAARRHCPAPARR